VKDKIMKTLNEGDTLYESKYDALTKLYEGQVAVAKAELLVYFSTSVGVAEHPELITSMDSLMDKLTAAEEKLKSLQNNF